MLKDGGILPKLVGLRTGFYLWLNFEGIISYYHSLINYVKCLCNSSLDIYVYIYIYTYIYIYIHLLNTRTHTLLDIDQ